jgi:hypothetical protein
MNSYIGYLLFEQGIGRFEALMFVGARIKDHQHA